MDVESTSKAVMIIADAPFRLPGGLRCLHLVLKGPGGASQLVSNLKDGTEVDMYADFLQDITSKVEGIGGASCAAIAASENRLLVMVEAAQKKAVKKKLKKEKKRLQFSFDKSADSAVDGGRLLERAIESMLRRGLREQGWMSFGNLFVHGNLTAGFERCVVDTLAMDVRLESQSEINLVLSLGGSRFRQFKFIEALPESFRPQFLKGENVDLTEWIYSHSDDSLSDFECRVLPFLESGYVVGGCSRAPDGVSAEQIRTLWIDKYGIKLLDGFTFLRVRFSFLPDSKPALFPSCCVLTAGGLVSAAPSVQNSRMEPALCQFLKDVEACKFFGASGLKVKRREGAGGSQQPRLLGQAPIWAPAVDNSTNAGKDGALRGPGRPSNLVELQKLPVIRREKPAFMASKTDEGETQVPASEPANQDQRLGSEPADARTRNGPEKRLPRPPDRPLIVPCFKKRNGSSTGTNAGQNVAPSSNRAQTTSAASSQSKKPSAVTTVKGCKIMAPSFGNRAKVTSTKVATAKAATSKGAASKTASVPDAASRAEKPGKVSKKRKKPDDKSEKAGFKKKEKMETGPAEKQGEPEGGAPGAAAEKAPRKRTTAADLDVSKVDALVRSKYTEQKLKDLSVPQMKNFLGQHKLKVGGKKEELTERINSFLQAG